MFGLGMAFGSFALLWAAANLLCAALSFAGLVFYVVVYTLMLKRRTWQNIVIGGAAGAFPPLVGWAAVSNNLTPLAYYLFAIIFMWTPVHFWALALLIKDEYAKVGVPMLPVVRGDRTTVVQIAMYAVLTVAVTLMPVFGRHVGWLYVASAVVLNVILAIRCVQLYKNTDRPRAVGLYKFSMLYLALLFLMLAVDQRWLYAVL
jgi:heme o synthase